MGLSAKDIRNVAVMGHSGDGKTSLCEAMLYNGKMTDRIGKTADGTTVCDYDDLEKQRKMSIYASLAYLTWNGTKINLIDLPGFYDFEGERIEGLSACDSAVVVIDASGVVPADTESMIETCLTLRKPLIIFVNGMDKDNANYLGTVRALQDIFPGKIAPIHEPIMDGNKMSGYVDVLQDRAYLFSQSGPQETEIPASLASSVQEIRSSLMESAAENDDELLDRFFDTGELTNEEIIRGIRIGIGTCSAVPLMAGSALSNAGVIDLLDAIVQYMPAAADCPPVMATNAAGDEMLEMACDENAPFAAQVFKTTYDPYSGKLNYIKVYSGKLKSGTVAINSATGKEERIGQIYVVRGKKTETVTELTAGDIGAVNKLTNTNTNDTLCAQGSDIKLEDIRFPRPNISMAVSCANKQDEDKMFSCFRRVMEEDYSFAVEKVEETGEMVISGQGEVQLDLISRKIKMNYGIDVIMSDPKVPYRETIRKTAEAQGRYKKQNGGHGQFGDVWVRFEPCEEGFEFAEEVVGGVVPKNYFPAVEKGLRECMQKGVLAGYPVTGVRAVLYDGSYHPVDSSEMAFKTAANLAFKDGIVKAAPVLLEPIVQLDITVPSDYVGAVMSDMSKRRGRVIGNTAEGKNTVITAEAPQSEVLKYATDLRSFTQGRGRFTSEFVRYEEVPSNICDKVVKERAASAQ